MLVLAAAAPHTFSLPLSLNSLDREGVRLLSPHDSQILPKQLQVPTMPVQVTQPSSSGSSMKTFSLLCFVSFGSLVEPSRDDQGSFSLGDVFLYLVP